jgi:hypothetical protein
MMTLWTSLDEGSTFLRNVGNTYYMAQKIYNRRKVLTPHVSTAHIPSFTLASVVARFGPGHLTMSINLLFILIRAFRRCQPDFVPLCSCQSLTLLASTDLASGRKLCGVVAVIDVRLKTKRKGSSKFKRK